MMTADEAKKALIEGGLARLDRLKPCSLSLNEVFHAALDYSTGEELDDILESQIGLTRQGGGSIFILGSIGDNQLLETDESYRTRGHRYHVDFDQYSGIIVQPSINTYGCTDTKIKKHCLHYWAHYQGIMESYDFCTKCDEKSK